MNSQVNSNAFFIDESTVIYPVGHELVQYNFEKKTQKIVHLQLDGDDTNCMAVNLSDNYLAIGTRCTNENSFASVHIFDINNGKKKKTFKTGDNAKELIAVSFSGDGKYMLAQGVGPEWYTL